MNSKPIFTCIIGIDGVGKTTHSNLILEYLHKKGMRCQYKWFRFHHFLSLPFLLFCRFAGYTRISTVNSFKYSYHEFYNSTFISVIYPWVLLFDTLLFTVVKIYVPMLFGISVVCDRFIYDTLIDISIAIKEYEIYKKFVGKQFIKLIPKNAHFIMLDLDKSNILVRRPELKYDLTFDERHELYHTYAFNFNIPIVINNGSLSDINKSITFYIDNYRK